MLLNLECNFTKLTETVELLTLENCAVAEEKHRQYKIAKPFINWAEENTSLEPREIAFIKECYE